MPSVITPKQKDRLLNRPGDESDEKVLRDRRLNDFYVRKALARWFGSIQDVNLALKVLPEKHIKKFFKDEDVYQLLEIAERAIAVLDFMPVQRNEEGKLITVKRLEADPKECGSPHTFTISREATELDKNRFSALQKHIVRLERFAPRMDSPAIAHGVHNDLDEIYYRDLIAMAKKEGYEPSAIPEREQWIPRFTPTQYQFREDRTVLDMLGFHGIEYPADLEILREALQSEEGKALMEKFRLMQELPPI